jgi:hypothetical protein
MLPDIFITKLDLAQKMVLGIPLEYDFLIAMNDGENNWEGICKRHKLQECVEIGLKKYNETK